MLTSVQDLRRHAVIPAANSRMPERVSISLTNPLLQLSDVTLTAFSHILHTRRFSTDLSLANRRLFLLLGPLQWQDLPLLLERPRLRQQKPNAAASSVVSAPSSAGHKPRPQPLEVSHHLLQQVHSPWAPDYSDACTSSPAQAVDSTPQH